MEQKKILSVSLYIYIFTLLLICASHLSQAGRSDLLKIKLQNYTGDPKPNGETESYGNIVYPSIFPEYIPPYLNFSLATGPKRILPKELRKYLTWIPSLKMMNQLIKKTGLKLYGKNYEAYTRVREENRNDATSDWFGFFTAMVSNNRVPENVVVQPYQRYNLLPGSEELCDKDKMYSNIQRHARKFGNTEFDFLLETYLFPGEIFQFLQRLRLRCKGEKKHRHGLKWIYKEGQGSHSNGYLTFQPEQPKLIMRPRSIIQLFMDKPYGGFFIRHRLYVLQTSAHPIRAYIYNKGDSMIKKKPFEFMNDTVIENGDLLKILARDGHDPKELIERMEDAILKTLFSAENKMAAKTHSNFQNSYNGYQLWTVDFIFDKNGIPWMNEFNRYINLIRFREVCAEVKIPMITETLNVAGYHFPPTMSRRAQEFVRHELRHRNVSTGQSVVFNENLYTWMRSAKTFEKAKIFSAKFQDGRENRTEYLEAILEDLQPDEVQGLMVAEDELSRTRNYRKLFPTKSTYKYLRFLESSDPYPYMLQDAWENKYSENRQSGINFLRKHASRME